MRLALLILPLLALAGCGGSGDGNSAAPVQSSTAVQAVAPPAGKQWTDVVAKTADGYRMGNPDAPIKLVEYGSRNCPICGRFAQESTEPLRKNYVDTGKVSYEFRDFLVHGAPDFAAALLNQCVPTEAFFGLLDQFFANQMTFLERTEGLINNNKPLIDRLQGLPAPQAAAGFADALGYIDFMKQRGVPEAKARACLADQKNIEAIAKVNADAVNVHGVNGTPSFFINGKIVSNVASWDGLEPALKAAGAR